jgi:hypothetical protein
MKGLEKEYKNIEAKEVSVHWGYLITWFVQT